MHYAYEGLGSQPLLYPPGVSPTVPPAVTGVVGWFWFSGLFGRLGIHSVGIVADVVTKAAQTYHGYKRNGDSLLWAALWGLLMPPVPGAALMLAQGFGKPAK